MFGGIGKAMGASVGKFGKAMGISGGKSTSIGPSGGMLKKMFDPNNRKKKLPRDSQVGGNGNSIKEGMKLLATNRPNIRTSGKY